MEVGPLFRRVATAVNKDTEGQQTPELSISLLGEFYFKPGAPAPAAGVAKKPDRVAKLEEELKALKQRLENQRPKEAPPAQPPSPETAAREPDRLLELGRRHLVGEGAPKDPAKAAEWFRKAAEAGQGEAMVELASLYERGEGVARNAGEAAVWYHRAAEKGVPQAMLSLGVLHLEGRGVTRNVRGAADWFRAAAEHGLPDAMHALGSLHERGEGVEKSAEEAMRWFQKAADAGLPDAMVSLADMHHHGKGVAPDAKRAASYMLEAIKRVPRASAREMSNLVSSWRPQFRRELQALLKEAGAYPGPIDGSIGPGTRRAIEAVAKK